MTSQYNRSTISPSERLEHYDNVRNDMRDEVKRRISQRDRFGIQCFITIGALLIAATQMHWVLLTIPAIAIYYTMQIFYSYQMHDVIIAYLKNVVEKCTQSLLRGEECNDEEAPQWMEWEEFLEKNRNKENTERTPRKRSMFQAIRRNFFLLVMWVVTIASISGLTLLLHSNDTLHDGGIALVTVSAIYIILNIAITYKFIKESR
jgi:hypothetical protein